MGLCFEVTGALNRVAERNGRYNGRFDRFHESSGMPVIRQKLDADIDMGPIGTLDPGLGRFGHSGTLTMTHVTPFCTN